MKLVIAIIMMVVMSTAAIALDATVPGTDVDDAQAVTDAGILPTSPLYGLDIAFEKISLALAGNDYSRAQTALEQAQEHLAEARIMAKQDKLEARDKALKEHDDRIADVDAHKNGLSEEHRAQVEEMMSKHLDVLRNVQAKLEVKGVPAATGGVQNAIENSQKALNNVKDAKAKPEGVGITSNIPPAAMVHGYGSS